jgi:hypothetical protein
VFAGELGEIEFLDGGDDRPVRRHLPFPVHTCTREGDLSAALVDAVVERLRDILMLFRREGRLGKVGRRTWSVVSVKRGGIATRSVR